MAATQAPLGSARQPGQTHPWRVRPRKVLPMSQHVAKRSLMPRYVYPPIRLVSALLSGFCVDTVDGQVSLATTTPTRFLSETTVNGSTTHGTSS